MTIILKSSEPIKWETFTPRGYVGFHDDWYNEPLNGVIRFCLNMDDENLWFTVFHEVKPQTHPQAEAGAFTPELWKYDVAELYLASPERDKYIELNLAANGAWWSAEFSEPRVLAGRKDTPFPGIKTYHEYVPDAGWAVAMSIPIAELERTLGFGDQAYGTVCSISNSPNQQFQSSAFLSGDHPDFHQPQDFDQLFIRSMKA